MFSQHYSDSSVTYISDIEFKWWDDESNASDLILTIIGQSFEDYDGYTTKEECCFTFDNEILTKENLTIEFCKRLIMSAVDEINEALSNDKLQKYASQLMSLIDNKLNPKILSDVNDYTCYTSSRYPHEVILTHSNKQTQLTYDILSGSIRCNNFDKTPTPIDVRNHIKKYAYTHDGRFLLEYYLKLKAILD